MYEDIAALLAQAKPGDKFTCRNGETIVYIGRKSSGHIIFEDKDGDLTGRHSDGSFAGDVASRHSVIHAGALVEVERFIVVNPEVGFATEAEAAQDAERHFIPSSVMKITFFTREPPTRG